MSCFILSLYLITNATFCSIQVGENLFRVGRVRKALKGFVGKSFPWQCHSQSGSITMYSPVSLLSTIMVNRLPHSSESEGGAAEEARLIARGRGLT